MSEAKYRYEIHPRIPMRNVLDKAIIKPTTVELTLDQVKECLKYGPVYRRFNADHIEKVTLFNIDALHAEKYDSSAIKNEVAKEEPKKPSIKFKEEPKPIVEEKVDEKVEEPASVIEDKVEEVKEEASVEESAPEEVKEVPTEEKVDEKVEETVSEAPVEEAVEEEKVAESSEEENVTEVTEEEDDDVKAPISNNYGGKKKKHH